LIHERELWVGAARVALPVWVLGDVACGDGDGFDERKGVVGAWGWVAELGVEGDAVGACGVDGEEGADPFPDAGGLDCVFLVCGQLDGGNGEDVLGRMYLIDGNNAVCGLQSLCSCLGGHGCSFECAIDSLLLGELKKR